MLGEVLHAFFFWMPAVVAIGHGLGMRHALARAIMVWGGGAFAVGMGVVVLGMLACDGKILTGYSACLGGADGLFAALGPALRGATYVYILAGPPLVGAAYLIEWLSGRTRRTA